MNRSFLVLETVHAAHDTAAHSLSYRSVVRTDFAHIVVYARARVRGRGLGILQVVLECERVRAPAPDCVARAVTRARAAAELRQVWSFQGGKNGDGGQEMTSLKVRVTTGNAGGEIDRHSRTTHLC